ncbi:MAG: putative transaldolase, partial [Candidatus Aminicenantes bacterium]|nr:putative transaldolase [Candidatus Aminicenantes bacterium]
MKLFLDSANLEEIREVAGWGVLDGVTTNPSLCSKESVSFEDNIRAICALTSGPVSAECVSLKAEEILVEARRLAKIAPNIAVKIPVGLEGLRAAKQLDGEGIAVNMTLIFSAGQALLAAKAGARFVSPFIGRLDDVAEDGMALIEEIVQIFENYQ